MQNVNKILTYSSLASQKYFLLVPDHRIQSDDIKANCPKVIYIWDTYARIFVSENFQKSSKLVTLLASMICSKLNGSIDPYAEQHRAIVISTQFDTS